MEEVTRGQDMNGPTQKTDTTKVLAIIAICVAGLAIIFGGICWYMASKTRAEMLEIAKLNNLAVPAPKDGTSAGASAPPTAGAGTTPPPSNSGAQNGAALPPRTQSQNNV